jgi:hypothetical protein
MKSTFLALFAPSFGWVCVWGRWGFTLELGVGILFQWISKKYR